MADQAKIEKIAARQFAEHRDRVAFTPLPPDLMPETMDDAYLAAEALRDLWIEGGRGPVGGYKIALTSKPIQELCGVDKPCGGFVFAETIHPSPARLSLGGYGRLALEFELAVRLGREMTAGAAPYTAETARDYVDVCLPAFELIDDRRADYATLDAMSMISDNVWCGGVVVGPPVADWQGLDLVTTPVRMIWNGEVAEEGVTGAAMGNPMESLAWLANLATERGWPMTPGMTIITGSTFATRHPEPGDQVVYAIDGIGDVEVTIEA